MTNDAKKTILLADDERALRLLLRATLGDGPYRLLEASDGDEALRLARQEHPDLALLDVSMPGLDGFAVCRALKGDAETAGIRVVMLTAHAHAQGADRGQRAGADGYLTKPFSPSELQHAIAAVLGTR